MIQSHHPIDLSTLKRRAAEQIEIPGGTPNTRVTFNSSPQNETTIAAW
jgi:hypothetical protein